MEYWVNHYKIYYNFLKGFQDYNKCNTICHVSYDLEEKKVSRLKRYFGNFDLSINKHSSNEI